MKRALITIFSILILVLSLSSCDFLEQYIPSDLSNTQSSTADSAGKDNNGNDGNG